MFFTGSEVRFRVWFGLSLSCDDIPEEIQAALLYTGTSFPLIHNKWGFTDLSVNAENTWEAVQWISDLSIHIMKITRKKYFIDFHVISVKSEECGVLPWVPTRGAEWCLVTEQKEERLRPHHWLHYTPLRPHRSQCNLQIFGIYISTFTPQPRTWRAPWPERNVLHLLWGQLRQTTCLTSEIAWNTPEWKCWIEMWNSSAS